jgi:hypothetical protein
MSTGFRPLRYAALIFTAVAAVYLLTALALGRLSTPAFSYFDQLAAALLDGRLYLEQPGQTHDLSKFRGRWYVPFPPLPALLMLPWQAALGSVNTTLFSIFVGAAGVTFIALTLRQAQLNGWFTLSPATERLLIALYALGSVHWYMVVDGNVWFVSQVTVSAALALALWLAAGNRSPWLIGAAVGAAMLGRPHVGLFAVLAVGIMLHRDGLPQTRAEWRQRLAWFSALAVPSAAAFAVLLAYNWARFADPLNFGYTIQNIAADLRGDLYRFGQFHPRFLERNLMSLLLLPPDTANRHGLLLPNMDGMSIFLTMPAVLLMFAARGPRWIIAAAWLTIGLILIPLLTYYNTGWQQFGYRFSLDFLPAAILLIAFGAVRFPRSLPWLVGYGIIVNLLGTLWFHLLR